MTFTQMFVEKAIEGGWDINGLTGQMNYGFEWKDTGFGKRLWCWDDIGREFWLDTNTMFLDPESWKAVGKVQVWGDALWIGEMKRFRSDKEAIETHRWEVPYWQYNMHRMIDHLAEGKDIESYLETLFTA